MSALWRKIMSVMDPHTLKALQESIAHWDRLASGNRKYRENVDVDACALCRKFNTPVKDPELKCACCPVFQKTGLKFCLGTPFPAAEKLSDTDELSPLDTDEFREAAQDELEFLKSLLPKEEPQ
jgi:hypothetical protein